MLSGYDEDELKEVLLKDIETEVYELRKGAALLDKIGDFAPAWGHDRDFNWSYHYAQNLQDTSNWYRDGSCDVNDIIWVCTCEYDCNPLAEKVYRGIEDLYTQKKFVIEAISELYRGQILLN